MLSGVCVGTNDLEKAGAFYDVLLETIGMTRRVSVENEIGYSSDGVDTTFWVLTPFDGNAANFGNGSQVMFAARDEESVQAFHAAAIKMGGTDEGLPGPRDYSPDYYGAYVRDLDGNKLHVQVDRRLR
ncbi:MAG: VOC family protein [Pseudomonadota bacterium]